MSLPNEDGYELWLRYRPVEDADRLRHYRNALQHVTVLRSDAVGNDAVGSDATTEIILRELNRALLLLLDSEIPMADQPSTGNGLVVGTVDGLRGLGVTIPQADQATLGDEGFLIRSHSTKSGDWIVVAGNRSTATLTGTFHFLRLLQTQQPIDWLNVVSHPRIQLRILGHWDNLDGSIERGYAGESLWQWADLPDKLDDRYHDYARACASIGINATCLNNVNAKAQSLTTAYLEKAAALADLFRPYGIQVYLSPLFSAPMQLDELSTSDPRDPAVARWWQAKVDEIYALIPDFGGFQVKANSEGQPGPQDYGANHDNGANMLADALAPHGGTLLWRAFVYDTTVDADRAKCAYKEFVPLDGDFRANVFIETKNGAIDFQPREPFHPLFGGMEKTPLTLEVQITQEYLGHSTHLVYLADMWKEVLDADTYAKGAGSTVAKVVDGSLFNHAQSSILGIANTGTDRNWCGHHFGQANWYAYGRLAWDYTLSADVIADEWIRATWSNEPQTIESIRQIMLGSWEACINYMTPLGLHHLSVEHHHYGPQPELSTAAREDWNNVYFHRADREGLGFDRSSSGSGATGQYHSPLRDEFDSLESCPEKYLLWFHHVPWAYKLQSGHTLWEELQQRYADGVAYVEEMQRAWLSLQEQVDAQRHRHVSARLEAQLENARHWQQTCVNYFGQFVD